MVGNKLFAAVGGNHVSFSDPSIGHGVVLRPKDTVHMHPRGVLGLTSATLELIGIHV
jgi:hypothetical protein